ncbi:ATPase involved in DNA repair [Chondromyces apiculatus DSM 436]|uniref:ATPase involved in DNA repair n=1 Tax=Chondromyces apiculatus DSM 436 TaxID=1192034 RepID=A0A017T2V4_9BACT|nr:ATPase involved in DNA repair [Chondromyces apiculatus DSM 436]
MLAELQGALEGGELVLFVGGGISAAAGLPTWRQLVDGVLALMQQRGMDEARIDEVSELARRHHYLDAMAAAQDALGPAFRSHVTRALDDTDRPIPPIARALAGLRADLRAVVTTNLNYILERAFGWEALSRLSDDIAKRRGFILKIQGTLRDPATWALTRERFHAQLSSPAARRALAGVFSACPVLFVGFGWGDDSFEQMLEDVRELSGGDPPPRFAMLPEASLTPFRRKSLQGMGFRLVPYDNSDGSHANALLILEHLASVAHAVEVRPAPRSILPPAIPDLEIPPSSSGLAGLAGLAGFGGTRALDFGDLEMPAGMRDEPPARAEPALVLDLTRRRMSEPPANPIEVFFSYAETDRDLRDKIETHLAMLKRKGVIRGWHEGEIGAGEEWDREIREHLESAKMILLLISADFLASDFCYEEQMRRAIQRHERGEARVIPVILDACDWEPAPFGKLRPLPENRKPVTLWPNQSEAFADIAKGIRKQVEQLTQNPS